MRVKLGILLWGVGAEEKACGHSLNAEITAINLALDIVRTNEPDKFLIFTDSLSVL